MTGVQTCALPIPPPDSSPLSSRDVPEPVAPTVLPASDSVGAVSAAAPPADAPASDVDLVVLKGPSARVVDNMEASLTVPTATSVRAVPAKLLIDNRTVINNALARGRGGKVSFTHIIGFAVVRALASVPGMNASFTHVDGKPAVQPHAAINLGIAIDTAKSDGSRQLLVPSIKNCQDLDFAGFWTAYEDLVRKGRQIGRAHV